MDKTFADKLIFAPLMLFPLSHLLLHKLCSFGLIQRDDAKLFHPFTLDGKLLQSSVHTLDAKEQAERLRNEFGVYMLNSSRVNVAGLSTQNMDTVVKAIVDVL